MVKRVKLLRSNTTATPVAGSGASQVDAGQLAYTEVGGVKRLFVGDYAGTSVIEIAGDSYAKLASPALTGVPTAPTAAPGTSTTQLATTAFVAAAIVPTSFDFKDSVRVAIGTDVTLTAPGATIDGVTMANGESFLAFGQTAPEDNGVYVFNGAAVAATRRSDFDTSAKVTNGATIANVAEGTHAESRFVMVTADPVVLGTTGLDFAEQSNTGLLAGDGIAITAGTVSAVVSDFAGAGLESDGSNNLRIAAAAAGAGLTGGAGSALAVGAGVGITVNADDVQIKADVTTGATVAPLSVVANGAGVTVDNASIIHTAGVLSVDVIDCGTF